MVVSCLTIGMPEHSKVKYGLVSNQYTYKATGGSVTYLKVSDFFICAWIDAKLDESVSFV